MTQSLRDLSTFNKQDINDFLESFDTVLVDADGVLWFSENPIPGSIETVNRLKQLNKKVFLVSNNCTRTLDEYVEKVNKLKLNLVKDEIIIPSVLAAEYLKEQKLNKSAFVLACPAFRKVLESSGISLSDDVGPDYLLEDAASFQEEIKKMDHNVDAVVIDFDLNINYTKLMKALVHLRKPNCLFVVGGTDLQVPVQGGFSVIGPGCFVQALELISGRKAVAFGKPSPMIKEFISKRHPVNSERTLMIGDMLMSDMKLGTDCGFLKMLVLSGMSKLEDIKEDETNVPHYYIQTLGDLLPLLPSSSL